MFAKCMNRFEKYDFKRYSLVLGALEEIKKIESKGLCDLEKSVKLLLFWDVNHVRKGRSCKVSFRGKRFTSLDVERGLRELGKKLREYENKYKDSYKEDLSRDKKPNVESQLEFNFTSGPATGDYFMKNERDSRGSILGRLHNKGNRS